MVVKLHLRISVLWRRQRERGTGAKRGGRL